MFGRWQLCVFGAAGLISTSLGTNRAEAWFESSISYKTTTPVSSGCIRHVSYLNHGGSDDEFWIDFLLNAPGMYGTSSGCQPAPSWSIQVKGQVLSALVKLNSRGATRDSYSYCVIHASSVLGWGDALQERKTWSSPPCGPGHYALIQCLQNVKTSAWHPWGIFLSGTRTDATVEQCNRTPTWHPAIDGGSSNWPVRW